MKSWTGSSLRGLTIFSIDAGHKFIANMTRWLSTPTQLYYLSDYFQGSWTYRRDLGIFWKNQGISLSTVIHDDFSLFYSSGSRKFLFLQLKCLSTNAGFLPSISISWACVESIIKVGSSSLSNSSRFGEANVFRVSVPFNPHTIGKKRHCLYYFYVTSHTTRVGIAICKWLFQMVHDTQAISVFDYILPLMASTAASLSLAVIQHLSTARVIPLHWGYVCFIPSCQPSSLSQIAVNDNEELESRANVLLVKICGVTPPRALVDPIFDAIFQAIRESPVSYQLVLIATFIDFMIYSHGEFDWKRYR